MENLLLKSLIEKRVKAHQEMSDLLKDAREKGSDIPDDKMDQYHKWEKEYDDLTSKITSLEAAEKKLETSLEFDNKKIKKGDLSQEQMKEQELKDFDTYLRHGWGGFTPERRIEVIQNQAAINPEFRANQFSKTSDKGGYTVPALIGDKIAAAQKYVGGMVDESVATWIRTSSGSAITFPTVDDTSVKAAYIAEAGDMSTGTDMTLATAALTFYKIATYMVKVSSELIQDSKFDFVGWLTDMLFKRMYRALNYYFTVGTGSSQPYGLKSTVSVATSTACAKRSLTRGNLLDLAYSVNRVYQLNGKFQFCNTTLNAIRQLYLEKADTYMLIQAPGVNGEPGTIEGFPYIVNDDVQTLAATHFAVYFGDFKNFYIAECLPMTIRRVDELYAATDEIGFNVLGRWAGNKISNVYPYKTLRCANT